MSLSVFSARRRILGSQQQKNLGSKQQKNLGSQQHQRDLSSMQGFECYWALRGQDRRLSAPPAGSRENVCGASEGETVRGVPESRTASASPTEEGKTLVPTVLPSATFTCIA